MKLLNRQSILFIGLLTIVLVALPTDVFSQEQKTDENKKQENTTQEEKSEGEKTQEEGDQSEDAESQDASADPDEEFSGELPADMDRLMEMWSKLNVRLDEVKKSFDEEEVPAQALKIRDRYARLIDRANEVIDGIKNAAWIKIDAGEKDQSLIETVIGTMINDAAFDRDNEVLKSGQKLISADVDVKYLEAAANADRLSLAGKEIFKELILRQKEVAADDLPRVKLTTSKGEIVLELFENEAPQTVGNFISLIESGFYDGLTFHRVIENFMAQGGCDKGDGSGGPGYNIYCECYNRDARRHFTGSLSMAKREPRDSGGSQFFITFARTTHLDGKHTVFGRVVEGMEVANELQRIDPSAPNKPTPDKIVKAEVLRKRDHEYEPTKVQ